MATKTNGGLISFESGKGNTLDMVFLDVVQSRIINANFVKKVVTAPIGPSTQPTVALGGITEGVFGRKVFIMVDTENMRGNDITIELIRHDDRSNDVISVTDGSADVASFTATVGDTSVLDDATGSNPYSNLADFEDKAIFKIDIRPHARTGPIGSNNFNDWAQQISTAKNPAIKIRVKPTDSNLIVNYEYGLANSSLTNPAGFIFGNYNIENKNVYEIYHPDNPFNFNPNSNDYNNNQRRQPISKLTNVSTDTVIYIYKDLDDNEHEVCESEIFEKRQVFARNGLHPSIVTPNTYTQAQRAFERVLTSLNPHPTLNRNIRIFNTADDALVQNSLTETPADLFQMLTDYRNHINAGTNALIVSSLTTQPQNLQALPQNLQTFINNSTPAQRQSMLIIDNVIDQTDYALEGVDARFTCEYANGIYTSGDTYNHQRRYYEYQTDNIKLIDAQIVQPLINLPNKHIVQPALNYTQGTLSIKFNFVASRRRYANPDLFAGFIGALAKLNYAHSDACVVSTGFSFTDGSCYPSTTHVNGEACDTLFFRQLANYITDNSNRQNPQRINAQAIVDPQIEAYQQPLIDGLWEYGFRTHYSDVNYTHVSQRADHDDHLHSFRFNDPTPTNRNTQSFIHTVL